MTVVAAIERVCSCLSSSLGSVHPQLHKLFHSLPPWDPAAAERRAVELRLHIPVLPPLTSASAPAHTSAQAHTSPQAAAESFLPPSAGAAPGGRQQQRRKKKKKGKKKSKKAGEAAGAQEEEEGEEEEGGEEEGEEAQAGSSERGPVEGPAPVTQPVPETPLEKLTARLTQERWVPGRGVQKTINV